MIACIWPNEQHGYETLSTLRFASRMKNIENTPVRNNVRNKDLGSRFQQQVEQLKRELIMRDAVCGVEAWLPELNKQQRERTIKCACTIALNNNSTSSSSSSSFFPSSSALGEHSSKPGEYSVSAASLTDTQQDTTLDVLDLHVRSLSHVRLLVGTFRALLWEACGQDEVVVERVCQSVCAKYDVVDNKILGAVIVRSGESEGGVVGVTGVSGASSSGSGSGSGRGVVDRRGSGSGGGGGGDVKNGSRNGDYDSVQQSHNYSNFTDLNGNNGTDGDEENKNTATSLNNTDLGSLIPDLGPVIPVMTFDEFTTTVQGLPLHSAYEETKSTLQQNKIMQRQIAVVLNNLKSLIDDLQEKHENFMNNNNSNSDNDNDSGNNDDSGNNSKNNSKKNIKNNSKNDNKNDNKNDTKNDNNKNDHSDNTSDNNDNKLKLIAAKKDYRLASRELELCKIQISEIQSLKKMALSALLSAYEARTVS